MSGRADTANSLENVLYGAEPSIIVTAGDLVEALREVIGVEVVWFNEQEDALSPCAGQSLKVDDLPSSPTSPCLLVATSAVSGEALLKLQKRWAERSAIRIPMCEISEEGLAAVRIGTTVLRVLLRQALEANQHSAEVMLDLHSQIVVLRALNEENNASISELKTSVEPVTPVRTVVCEPSGDTWLPKRGDTVAIFEFPFRARGLSQMDLHFNEAGESGGLLFVSINAAESSRPLGAWEIPFGHLGGWLPLRFRQTVSAQCSFLRLKIAWHTQFGLPPRLSLSEESVQLRGAGTIDGPMRALRLPAIRLYTARPGQIQSAPHWCDR